MEPTPMVAVEIPYVGDERHKNWAKIVEHVDTSKASGWAFDGPFVAVGGIQDVPAGSTLLIYGERGSRANPQITARVYTANADATLTFESEAKGRAWARTLRDVIEERLGEVRPMYDLAHLPDDVLAAELRSRGWTVSEA
jgi:hypothetical protein